MALGMTYDQYWYGDPLMVRAFYKADKIRRRRIDEEAWLQGAYVLKALQATVGNMFLKKSATPFTYPEEPFSVERLREEERKKKQTKEDLEKDAIWAMAWMSTFVNAGKNWGKRGDVPWQEKQDQLTD